MTDLIRAVLRVMDEVKNIDKNLNVGSGASSYKGVADKDVKQIIGDAMAKNGLVIFPTKVDPKTTISEWDSEEVWNGQKQTKHKTQVLTEVITKYTLYHDSGEHIELEGYGHGVDSQDKSAGKATTYALKNTLLYTFLVPTGSIDDTDTTHSNELDSRPKTASVSQLNSPKSSENYFCEYHKVGMRLNKNGKPYHMDSKRVEGDKFCNGSGFPSEHKAWNDKNKNLAQDVANEFEASL